MTRIEQAGWTDGDDVDLTGTQLAHLTSDHRGSCPMATTPGAGCANATCKLCLSVSRVVAGIWAGRYRGVWCWVEGGRLGRLRWWSCRPSASLRVALGSGVPIARRDRRQLMMITLRDVLGRPRVPLPLTTPSESRTEAL